MYSFLGMTQNVIDSVNEAFPGSRLMIARGGCRYIVDGPTHIEDWLYFFLAPDSGTVVVRGDLYGEVGEAKYVQKNMVGYRPIPWPFRMDISDADGILKNKGINWPYDEVELAWLSPAYEPSYYFHFVNGKSASVGIYSEQVIYQGIGL